MAELKVTLIRSRIGKKPKQRGTIRALGLGRRDVSSRIRAFGVLLGGRAVGLLGPSLAALEHRLVH